ncbi:MAG: SIR2 family protein [Planctomycetia bacterium]|nr:SIR2 family protein [Planctomycetia bacterium]
MRTAHDELEEGSVGKEAIKNVLSFRLASASAAYRVSIDPENVEELFSLASARSDQHLRNAMPFAIGSTITQAILRTPEPVAKGQAHAEGRFALPQSWFDQGDKEGWASIPAYDVLAAMLTGCFGDNRATARNTFISFNYDLLLEKALENLSISYQYHLPTAKVEDRRVVATSFRDSSPVDLLKIHGSLNWGVHSSTADLVVFKGYEDLVDCDKMVPLLVPPTWRKVPVGFLDTVWDRAVAALATATRLVVLGFSIPPTDTHFKYLLAAGLQNKISLRKVIFVDPRADLLRERVRGILRGEWVSTKRLDVVGSKIWPFLTNQQTSHDLKRFVKPCINQCMSPYLDQEGAIRG